MKVISIWQPFASLIVEGCKVYETRGWKAPDSIIGTRIGIASTKTVLPAQREHCADEKFKEFYERTGLDDWLDLPRGTLLGTVEVEGVELISEELLSEVSFEEMAYGWWTVGGYAWRLIKPIKLEEPIPIRGMQGLYEWKGDLPDVHTGKVQSHQKESHEVDQGRSQRPEDIRRHLRVVG